MSSETRPPLPQISFTGDAIAQALSTRDKDDPDFLRLEISSEFRHSLTFDHQMPDDIVVPVEGLSLVLDPTSASRAHGVKVDFVMEPGRSGFKIDNPNKPAEGAAAPPTKASLSEPVPPPRDAMAPKIEVTDAALAKFRQALAEEDGPAARGVKVSAKRQGATRATYELDVIVANDRTPGGFEVVKGGVPMWIDVFSARIVDGAVIDFVESEHTAGFKFKNERLDQGWGDPRAEQIENLFMHEVNPGIAAHGGYVELLDIYDDTCFVLMGGGCQGCGMAGVTLNEGIAERIKQTIPTITRVIDSTDHASGTNPYYGQGG